MEPMGKYSTNSCQGRKSGNVQLQKHRLELSLKGPHQGKSMAHHRIYYRSLNNDLYYFFFFLGGGLIIIYSIIYPQTLF